MPATSCPFPFSPPSNKRRLPAFVLCLLLHAVFLSILDTAMAAEQSRTLQSFGVHLKSGQPVHPLPSHVALGLFNPDPLLDVAYYVDGKVQVYQNMGNGLFDLVGEKQLTGEVEKMEWRKERMFGSNPDQFSWGELHIFYMNGRNEVVSHEQLVFQPISISFAPQAPMNPPLDFRETWRSELQDQPSTFLVIGDIDNDALNEVAYSFDSNRFVVFESAGNDSFVVDWDTVIANSYGPFAMSDVDNNERKELVLGSSGQIGQLMVLECLGPGSYRHYNTNIFYSFPPFKVLRTDIDHDGVRELCLLTSNPSAPPGQDATFIYVAEFAFKDSATMWFSIQTARYYGYTFDMAVGQVDGTGRDEIIPAGGSFGINEPVPVDYLWYNGTSWTTRSIYTGLRSGTTAPMFVNLDDDTTKELFIGGVGPIGYGSCYALDYVSDTTWRVMWADSTLRSSPLSMDVGFLGKQYVVAGANTWERVALDTLYTQLHVYQPSGVKLGIWQRDTASVQNFHFLDIDNDGRTDLVSPILSPHMCHFADYEYYGTTHVTGGSKTGTFGFQLFQNYPNPFNPRTEIDLYLPHRSQVEIRVYDMLGKEIKTLLRDDMLQGSHTVSWDGTTKEGGEVSSGGYLYRLTVRSSQGLLYTQVKKMLLLR